MDKEKEKYNLMSKSKILKEFETSMNGLSDKEVKHRLTKYGKNELPKEKQKSVGEIFFGSLKDPIIYVLIAAALFSFIAKEVVDAAAIVFIILIDAIVSTVQEYRAEKNSEALKNLIKFKVKVVRNSKHYEIDSENIVPGDIIVLESGTQVSADARILSCNNLTVDESVLTGESIGVNKTDDVSNIDEESRSTMIYAGTSVLTGRALAVVVATGIKTEVGKIAEKVTSTERLVHEINNAMEEQKDASQQILIALRDMNDATSQVQTTSKQMANNFKMMEDASENLDNATNIVKSRMDEMTVGAGEIEISSQNVSDMASKTRENISTMEDLLNKFKLN
jgi:magnesium-transporting ATPase (P-type)